MKNLMFKQFKNRIFPILIFILLILGSSVSAQESVRLEQDKYCQASSPPPKLLR